MISLFKALWSKLDGKKTIGGIVVLLLTAAEAKYPGSLLTIAEWVKQALEDGGAGVGGLLTAVGITHKLVKASK